MNSKKSIWKNVQDCNESDVDTIVLTFDIDWACDAVLLDSINMVREAGVPATWFVTHETPLLDKIRSMSNQELGVHPNFLPLFEKEGISAEKILDELLSIVPEAVSIRSHSMVQSSRLMDLFVRKGLKVDCNHYIPEQARICLKPWRLWNGLLKVPHFWEDDAVAIFRENSSISDLINRMGTKVFDFHPIHIFLNTKNLGVYEKTRPFHQDADKLLRYRSLGFGSRFYLKELMSYF